VVLTPGPLRITGRHAGGALSPRCTGKRRGSGQYLKSSGLLQGAGLPRIRVHDLRHSHATLLLAEGIPVHVVSRRLGHAKTSITVDTYAHVMAGQDEVVVAAFDRLLERMLS